MRIATVLLALALVGCAAHVAHPGSANKYDSNGYDAIFVTHNVIETTKTDLTNNAFPASIVDNVKAALNKLIQGYNVADTAYQTYHQAALAGTATAAQQTTLSNALNDLNAQTAALTAAKAGK